MHSNIANCYTSLIKLIFQYIYIHLLLVVEDIPLCLKYNIKMK